jgi:hypothetical protein
MSQPRTEGGIGLGTTMTSAIFLFTIFALVVVLSNGEYMKKTGDELLGFLNELSDHGRLAMRRCSKFFGLFAFLILVSPANRVIAAETDPVMIPYGFIDASYWWASHSIASLSSLNSNFSAPVASGIDSGSR